MKTMRPDKNDFSCFRIRIYETEGAAFRGEVENFGTSQKQEFNSLLELIALCEEIMDAYQAPLPMLQTRSWDRDEGSVEKQIDSLLAFMQRTKGTFIENDEKRDTLAEQAW